jgi:hypothetical protein
MIKFFFFALVSIFMFQAVAQNVPAKHPRVAEVEERLRDEASRYFSRRFPGEPFFVRVDISPLRRDMIAGRKTESLPYFDYESEESVDEWDDLNTPISLLRNRVTKVTIEIAVPEKFNDTRVAGIKDELSIYLKLLPYRDEIRVEKKLKDVSPFMPFYVYPLMIALLISALIGGFIIRSGFSKMKTQNTGNSTAASVSPSMAMPSPQRGRDEGNKKGSTSVSGDVTFHDPIKTIDIVHLKMEQISKSGTFPTLNDLISLSEMGETLPERLGALLCEMPGEWQKTLFPLGQGQSWLEAFSHPGRIDHDCLVTLDRLGKERSYVGGDRNWEDLLIQIWRMGEKSIPLFKKIQQDHAFIVLNALPKSISLGIAKKAFPGAWGKLLENKPGQVIISPQVLSDYLSQSLAIEPRFEWKILESYRKDRELLKYLDRVSIDDEKDVYQTLSDDSFVFRVRPGFYRVFELEGEQWKKFVARFPLEKWALVAMNSSRSYIRQITEALDDKQRLVFSQYLKVFDQGFSTDDQVSWRKVIAESLPEIASGEKPTIAEPDEEGNGDHAKSA